MVDQRRIMHAFVLASALALPHPADAQDDALDAVAFMAGTWCSEARPGATVIEEHYSTPSANLVLGTTRYLRDGVSVGYELSRIEADSVGVILTPMPSNQPAVPFRLTESAPGRVVFENPDHDFPVRIEYHRVDGGLVARALGAEGNGPEWRMAPCAAPRPPESTGAGGVDGSALFERLAGAWEGTGTLFDTPAAFSLRWSVADGLATLHFTNALVDDHGATTPVLTAVAVYRVTGAPEGVWLDTRGERVELRWAISGGAMVVTWRASGETGRTTYRPADDGTLEVVDEVAAPEGWRVFGRATHRRVGTTP